MEGKTNLQPSGLSPRRMTCEERTAHLLIEWHLLKSIFLELLFLLSMQMFHSFSTNVAYWEASKSSLISRIPLRDLGHEYLPFTPPEFHFISELLVYFVMGIAVSIMFSTPFMAHPPPLLPTKTQPFAVIALRRFLVNLVLAQTLRTICFVCTVLPAPAIQCAYKITESQLQTPLGEFLNTVAPEEGNPRGWEPPRGSEVVTRIDPTRGCGDLVFSSHMTFVLLAVLSVDAYTSYRKLKVFMKALVVVTALAIISARKHYTLDVVVALFSVPLLYFYTLHTYPDPTSEELRRKGLVFDREEMTCKIKMGRMRRMHPQSVPRDLAPTIPSSDSERLL